LKTQTKNKNRHRPKRTKSGFKKSWNGVPATVRQTLFTASLFESVFASLFWHIVSILLIWFIIFLFMFFGIIPKIFPKPEPKMRDIEFIIKNSSGHRIKHIKTMSKSNGAESQNPVSNNSEPKENTKPTNKTSSDLKTDIPDFSMPMPNLKSIKSGLNSSAKSSRHAAGQNSNPSIGDINNAFSTNEGASDNSGFDKNTSRKIITAYDISPYVNELKRNIRWNWKAPTVNGNKRVELFLRIAKDGRLIILNVKRTSEIGEVDNAALNAVKKSLPLNPLPAKYNKGYLDIIFTFDSNSISSRY
jgi:hypothetical protein